MNLGEKIFILDELSSLHNPFLINRHGIIDAHICVHNNLISPLLLIINTMLTLQIDLAMKDN